MELLQISDRPATRNADIANYEFEDFSYRSFGMFHGDPVCVTLRVSAELMDVIVDRFGRNVDVVRASAKGADVRVNVLSSPQFFGWIAGMNGGITIKAPKKLAGEYNDWLKGLITD